MERRVFVAILLSLAVLYGYQALFTPPPPAPTSKPAVQQQSSTTTASQPTATSPPATSEPARAPEPAAFVTEASERQIVVETGTAQVVLTNRGGRILHW